MNIFHPNNEQLIKGIQQLTSEGIVFEGNSTFIHNRADEYIESLKENGYTGKLLGIGVNITSIGYMYAVYDPNQIDCSEAKKLVIKYFTNK